MKHTLISRFFTTTGPYKEHLTALVELDVNAEAIFRQLAGKAILSKGKRARLLNGAVVVRVVGAVETAV
jgi:hypothetical protein